MKHLFILSIFFFLQVFSFAQDTLFLDSCIKISIKNYPIYKDKMLNKQISDLSTKNNRSNFIPSIDFEGKVSYQSDAFRLDVDLPDIPGFEINFPTPPLDQYNIALNFSQLIYDGGLVKNLNTLEQIKSKNEIIKTDIELYALNEQIEKTFFSILILQQTGKQLEIIINELKKKKSTLNSAINNGLLTHDNLNIIQAEILKLEQSFIEVEENKNAAISILSEFMLNDISGNVILQIPENKYIDTDSLKILRPEIKMFSIQSEIINANKKLLFSDRFPKLVAFAQTGYGNPGLTMISDEWNPYFILGAKLSWRVWDKNNTKRNYEILNIKSDLIATKTEVFEKNIRMLCEKELSEITKIEKFIEKDIEIIQLRENICKQADSRLNNGTITSVDYLSLINEKNRASILFEIHKIQLVQAKRNYLRITGNTHL